MNKTYGVCAGLLALGLVGFGAPASHAKTRLAADEAAGASETSASSTTSSTSAAAESAPADLQQRIDALKAELAALNTELATKKDDGPAVSADPAPQDQSAPAATPAPAAAPAAPAPLPTPSMSGPWQRESPHELPAGPFGKIEDYRDFERNRDVRG